MSKKFYDARTTSPEHSIIAYSNYASIQPTKKKKKKRYSAIIPQDIPLQSSPLTLYNQAFPFALGTCAHCRTE